MEGRLGAIENRGLSAQLEQTTVLAGPSREVSLAACAHQVMNMAGLLSLSDTYAAIRVDPGKSIHVAVDSDSNELHVSDVPPNTRGFVVVEGFGSQGNEPVSHAGQPRGWLFETEAGAAAFYGTKLMLQNAGVVTVRNGDSSSGIAAHYVGAGFSGITSLTMSPLPA